MARLPASIVCDGAHDRGLGPGSSSGRALGLVIAVAAQAGRPRRVAAQARGRCQGLRHAHPGTRRLPGPRRLVPLRGAGHVSWRSRSLPSTIQASCEGRARPRRAAGLDGVDRPPDTRRLRHRRAEAFRGGGAGGRQDAEAFQGQLNEVRPASRPWRMRARRPPSSFPAARHSPPERRARREIATRDDVDLLVVATGGVVSLRPILAALRPRHAGGHRQQGDAGGGRSPGHATAPASWPLGTPATRGAPARSSGCARSTPSTRPSGSAWPGKRLDEVRRLILTASGGPFRTWPRRAAQSAHPGAGARAPELVDGRRRSRSTPHRS